ncbi:MAG: RNA polymerase sigma factor [Planctomycetota bacterium]
MSDSREQIIDQILVMDSQAGSSRAMEMLVSRWQKRLWQHAHRLTGDTEAAWDITQQSWLAIIKGLRKLHDPASFKPWAYRITTNKSADWIKRKQRQRQVAIEEVQDCQSRAESDTGLKELLEKLDIRKRAVLSLYYFEQLSIAEIGSALKIPAGTVKSRLSNARKELKELWHKHFDA